MQNFGYKNAIDLLYKASSENGFLASAEEHSNYKRVWARDGVITGLAALASGEKELIATFEKTLDILAKNQHDSGTIPSNVLVSENYEEVSYGGLAGRLDAVTWFIIGVCQYSFYTNDPTFVDKYETHITKCLRLMDAWEFNNKHLIYTPLSGNWADEYITDGYVLYDQLLRIWALKCYNYFVNETKISLKINQIQTQLEINFTPSLSGERYHEKAYDALSDMQYMPCSFSPAGYKEPFDAFGNSLALLLNIGDELFQSQILNYAADLTQKMELKLIPAFWPPIFPEDSEWNLLKNNCKYEFRNYPYTFHNGGIWPMVNGFYGLALMAKGQKEAAIQILNAIHKANVNTDNRFFENYNSQNAQPNGVPYCTWSAAATVLLEQSVFNDFKLLM